MSNPIHDIYKYSQSIWYDNIQRGLLKSGAIRKMIEDGEITGITSNPSIFEKAIGGSQDYDAMAEQLLKEDPSLDVDNLYEKLVIEDIREAADLLAGVYQQTNGLDGYISIEVSPRLAHDSQATIEQARHLFATINRPNVMIKVPATAEGLPAVTALLGEGIHVNVTLMFSMQDFIDVSNAYLAGLEKAADQGRDLSKIASVASFFISRIDSSVDKQLPEDSPLRGKTAIAYARNVYQKFKEVYSGERFEVLKQKGARVQRVLWASTSTKNPQYRDVIYAEELIGPDTVNTLPPVTLDAFRDHGQARLSVTENLAECAQTLEDIKKQGIDMQDVTAKLKEDGVEAFRRSFDSLIDTLAKKRQSIG